MALGAAAWLWRTRAAPRVPAFAGAPAPHRVGRSRPASLAPAAAATIVLPAGIECAALQCELRRQFVCLQAAWDRRDIEALRGLTTRRMLDDLCFDAPCGACGPSCTDVVTLRAELLGFEDLGRVQWVSVEFSGLMREAADEGAQPFRELWMLARSTRDEDCGWKLARHQSLL